MKFLEKYVQWLAVGLGAAYLLLMAWLYFGYLYVGADMPLKVTLDSVVLPPDKIDQTIVDKAIVPLEAAMANTKVSRIESVDPAAMTITIIDGDDRGTNKLTTFKVTRETEITAVGTEGPIELSALTSKPIGKLVTIKAARGGEPLTAEKIRVESPLVEAVQGVYNNLIDERLTNKTALAMDLYSTHQAPGSGPVQEQGPQPPIPPVGAVVVDVPTPTPAIPGPMTSPPKWMVILPPPKTPGGAAPPAQDVAVVDVIFTIDSAALSAAINKAYKFAVGLPPAAFDPQITRVYLYREESSDGGKTWSEPKLLDPLPTANLVPYMGDSKEKDPAKLKQILYEYKSWVEKNQAKIRETPFYKTAKDTEPYVRPGANPAAPGGGGPNKPGPVPPVVKPAGAAPVVNKDIEILVHDVTLSFGKSYRYALKYRLLSALFDRPQAAAPGIEAKFDVESVFDPKEDKYWTPAVTVEPTSSIFVTKVDTAKAFADFAIFIWKSGKWTKYPVRQKFAGDTINAQTTVTDWTVVDVRRDPHIIIGRDGFRDAADAWYVLIMDEHGEVSRRDVRADLIDPNFERLKKMAGDAPGPAAAAAGGAPLPQ